MQHLDREGISFCCRTTNDDNAITNAVEIFNTSSFAFTLSGAIHLNVSNNDSGVRDYDMERFQLCKHFQFEWPVNIKFINVSVPMYFIPLLVQYTSLSPDRKVVVVVGDDPDSLLIDADTEKICHQLKSSLKTS
ncbi:hypothetical protein PR202_ga17992 [Eleusine coracana subsp. coracana]|uniref:Uncharacterized protein n=1 Tax=Eleusine coracana subsp. coracana TaxID=191504 RepID=A0AAV5CRJ7_ELECO|nr:hypothetical protein PR202_ga17992 [Eleusine coracana subsp. coracana]